MQRTGQGEIEMSEEAYYPPKFYNPENCRSVKAQYGLLINGREVRVYERCSNNFEFIDS
jgi:hypothetical protein